MELLLAGCLLFGLIFGAAKLIKSFWDAMRRLFGKESTPLSKKGPLDKTASPPLPTLPKAKRAIDYGDLRKRVVLLKREGKYEPALALLNDFIQRYESGTEGARSGSWAYQQAAIIYRKLDRYEEEVAIAERYVQNHLLLSKSARRTAGRLPKAYLRAGLAEKRDGVIYHLADGCPAEERDLFVRRAVFLDTETTGLSKKDELIELALVLISFNQLTGEIIEELDSYVGQHEPSRPIPARATRVHGLTKDSLKGKRMDTGRIEEIVAQADVVVAHNASFDRRFIGFKRLPWLCSMNGVSWSKKGYESKALGKLLAAHGFEAQEHRAMDDLRALIGLLKVTDDETGRPYFDELIQSRPLSAD